MKKVAVILSGCGVYDGAEIHEAVLTLLALERAGAQALCAAPDIAQREVINHQSGTAQEDEFRNVLEESARIARGEIKQLSELRPQDLDALVFVGGFGVAKNLSSFASDGAEYDVDPMVRDVIEEAHAVGKPLGFMCIAPVLAAAVLGSKKVRLTIGHDRDTAAKLVDRGAIHAPCDADSAIVDRDNKIVTTPAFMEAQSLLQAEAGINKLIDSLLELCA